MGHLPQHVTSAHGLRLELPSPEARTDSDDLAKHTGEMGLVAHSAFKSDLRKRLSSVQHDDLGVVHPPYFDIGERRLTETRSECVREVADAELYDAREVRKAEAEADRAGFESTSEQEQVESKTQEPTQEEEHVHHHLHETVQPVI